MTNEMSNCCSGKVYSPTKEWARCLTCLEYCDVVNDDIEIIKSWYQKRWISYKEYLRLTGLAF